MSCCVVSKSAGSARSAARTDRASLSLEIDPDQIRYIPANVKAQISATTAFGTKFVELVYPPNPSPKRLAAGAVLHSKNVSTEINTVFENVVELLKLVDPLKLNAVLTAVADGVRGQGERMGQATTDLNEVLLALNARAETMERTGARSRTSPTPTTPPPTTSCPFWTPSVPPALPSPTTRPHWMGCC